jgi:hypothetical protein
MMSIFARIWRWEMDLPLQSVWMFVTRKVRMTSVVDEDFYTVTDGPLVRRWRSASFVFSIWVLGFGSLAAIHPSFSGSILTVAVICALVLFCWASWLSESGYRSPKMRVLYTMAVFESSYLSMSLIAWRVLNITLMMGFVIVPAFIVCIVSAFVFRRRLAPFLTYGVHISSGTIAFLSMVLFLLSKIHPEWFVSLALPALAATLLLAASVPVMWARVEGDKLQNNADGAEHRS